MSNATDWISAGANIVMAVTAFMAYRVGRNYLLNLTNNDAYKLAFEIKDELLPNLKKAVRFIYRYNSIERLLNELLNDKKINTRKIKTIFNRSLAIRGSYLNIKKQEKSVKLSLRKLDGYGWGSIGKKEVFLEEITNASSLLEATCDKFDDEIDSFVSAVFGVESIEGDIEFDISKATFDENYSLDTRHINKLLDLITKIRSSRDSLDHSYEKYMANDNYIGLFFKRQKGHI
ncbi:hypothetical protein [Citrobacter koseri]|uniref:hypothetical protein n=1 Tax=Citrobacter koseri TaxID=545 RepID=UPI0029427618|nr:hypothetical protein [Citrobacter koseri]MEB2704283.1 hypothetical protein [Citrobacter koseri]MEB2710067.1 hypothetical protein [Citrobacter koseri]MEB2770323.1 hypothetical protein [Citrobacter koseri]WOJ25733.1 hypothetical protein R1221_19375 [Citrobacter koseri]